MPFPLHEFEHNEDPKAREKAIDAIERCLIGDVIWDPQCFELARQVCSSDFRNPTRGDVWDVIRLMIARKQTVGIALLANELEERGLAESLKGAA